MAKVGRPPVTVADRLPEGWQERILQMGREGASDVEIRAELGITPDLWYAWKGREPEFATITKAAKDLAEAWWIQLGKEIATGKTPKSGVAAWIFSMKNRFGWVDKQEISQDPGSTISAEPKTAEAWLKQYTDEDIEDVERERH